MRLVAFTLLALLLPVASQAASTSSPTGIEIGAMQAYEMKLAEPDQVLLLDVRTRAEIQHTGMATTVDANIPYRFQTTDWKMKKNKPFGSFRMLKNPDFAESVKNLITTRGLSLDTPVIIMCKGGTRAPWAAKALHEAGLTKVYTQVEGFEGKKAKDGPDKGQRVVNGWKNVGLPWSYNLPAEKMYFNFEPREIQLKPK